MSSHHRESRFHIRRWATTCALQPYEVGTTVTPDTRRKQTQAESTLLGEGGSLRGKAQVP